MILQTCLPDYRLPFFERLIAVTTGGRLICGRDYFAPSLALCNGPAPWRTYIENRFFLSGALLWQSGVNALAAEAEVVIAEFNPRILSTWVLLLRRRLKGKRTLLWGHLWGQHGPQTIARHLRLAMLQLSDGMICYTRSQCDELHRIRPKFPSWAASNSCVMREICQSAPAPAKVACITYVGRLIAEKKPALLLEAFARALPRLPLDAKLLLIGEGAERAGLLARSEQLELSGRIELPGHVTEVDRLRRIYSQTLVAVSPGYVGLSAVQSMAFGVPMLVSRSEPHSPEIEACVEGRTAVFFDTDNLDSLADKLVGFFAADSPWRAKREEISRFIASNYTFDGMVETFVEAIESARLAPAASLIKEQHAKGEVPKVAVVWAQFGPYHLARLKALHAVFGRDNLLAVEIGSRTSTYAWQRDSSLAAGLVTLRPGQAAEEISAATIYQAALEVFRAGQIDVVFVPSYWPASSLAVTLAAHTVGARVVMMNDSHALTAKAQGVWAVIKRRLVLQFDAAFVAGKTQQEYFANMGVSHDKIVTGYDVVDNDYFENRSKEARSKREEVRARHGLPERYFLNVGRMIWKKNLETLVDAYKLVKDRVGPACPRLVLVGSGRLERTLRERCLGHGLSVWQAGPEAGLARAGDADVLFYGFKQVGELPEFYALADCFVLPSREEEWGLVVNEAMACGLPVLVSAVAGCAWDLVRHGENGFLFQPFDATELTDYLEIITRQPELAQEMGRASERIIADWSCESFALAARAAASIALGGVRAEGGPSSLHKMNDRRNRSFWRYGASLMLMRVLDAHQMFRRRISRTFLRSAATVLSLGLLMMVFTSLYALRQVTRSVESLMVDSMVGLESAVAMRSAVRETQMVLLRLQATGNHRLLEAELTAFEKKFADPLAKYGSGVFDDRDEQNLWLIKDKLGKFRQVIRPLTEDAAPGSEAYSEADRAARTLIDAVEQAYQFNRAKVRMLAQDASDAAGRALRISNRIWWSLGGFGLSFLLIYLAYRWLALPEAAND